MVRPRKNDDEKRSETARFRLTLSERESLRSNAARVGLSETEFMRRRVLDLPLPSSTGSDPLLIAALNNHALELSRIGNNLNQLAAATHQGRDFTMYWQEIGDKVQEDLQRAKQALNDALENMNE